MVQIIDTLIQVLIFAIVARAILSFVIPMVGNNPHPMLISAVRVVNQITDPILLPIRRVLPNFGMFDLSPMVAIVVLFIIKRVFDSAVG